MPQAGVCSGIPVSLTAHTVTCTSEPYCFDLPGYAFSIVKYLQLSLGVFLTSKFFLPVVTRQGAVPLLPSSGFYPGLFLLASVAAPQPSALQKASSA